VATLTVDPARFETRAGGNCHPEWLVRGRAVRSAPCPGKQAVVPVHVLTGTYAPGTHWSDTMGGLRGVHLTRVRHHLRRPHVGCDKGDRALLPALLIRYLSNERKVDRPNHLPSSPS